MDENSFFSLDKLVEFGLGMGVATQMANSMNQSLEAMRTPGVDNPMRPAESAVYYAVLEGKSAGPFLPTELSRLIADGKVSRTTYVWKPGMHQWERAENVSEVLRLVALTPPPIPTDEGDGERPAV